MAVSGSLHKTSTEWKSAADPKRRSKHNQFKQMRLKNKTADGSAKMTQPEVSLGFPVDIFKAKAITELERGWSEKIFPLPSVTALTPFWKTRASLCSPHVLYSADDTTVITFILKIFHILEIKSLHFALVSASSARELPCALSRASSTYLIRLCFIASSSRLSPRGKRSVTEEKKGGWLSEGKFVRGQGKCAKGRQGRIIIFAYWRAQRARVTMLIGFSANNIKIT